MIIGQRVLIWLVATLLLWSLLSNPAQDPAGPIGQARLPSHRSTVVDRGPATFTESYRWLDGLSVEVVEVDHGTLLPSMPVDTQTARPGDPCSELTIVVRNESAHTVRIALTARLRYGSDLTPAATYAATAGHAHHASTQYLGPGDISYPYTLGFVLPAEARDNVVLDLGVDSWKHERALFAGSIAAR